MMKVALELQPCCGNKSGIGIYTYELAKRLHNDNEFSYQGNVFNFRGCTSSMDTFDGVDIFIAENQLMPYGVYRRVWNIIPLSYKRLFPVADINHFFNYIVPPRIDGKVITTIHDMTYIRFPETVDAKNLKRIQRGITYSIERSDLILTVSEFSKREIAQLLKVPKRKIAVVYSAPSFQPRSVDFSELEKMYPIRKPYILYVGTIEPRKNLVRLLYAFEKLKREANIPHQLVLAGGKGWKCDEIYQTAHKISGAQDIIFCGYVSTTVKNTLYMQADAFVFPSLYEGFGIPPLEAMTYGVPTICANAASLPEVTGGCAKLVNPFSELDIAEGIYEVINNPDVAAKLRREGQTRVQQFSWDRSVEKLKNIYRDLMN